MSKSWQLVIGIFSAGAVQFGFLVTAGMTDPLPLSAGVLGAMGAAAGAMLKQLPRKEWNIEKRNTKQKAIHEDEMEAAKP